MKKRLGLLILLWLISVPFVDAKRKPKGAINNFKIFLTLVKDKDRRDVAIGRFDRVDFDCMIFDGKQWNKTDLKPAKKIGPRIEKYLHEGQRVGIVLKLANGKPLQVNQKIKIKLLVSGLEQKNKYGKRQKPTKVQVAWEEDYLESEPGQKFFIDYRVDDETLQGKTKTLQGKWYLWSYIDRWRSDEEADSADDNDDDDAETKEEGDDDDSTPATTPTVK